MMKNILYVVFLCFAGVSAWAVSDSALDARARQLMTYQEQTKQQVVENLTQGLVLPADKARVLAAWIAYQVDRNGYEHRKLIKASSRNVLAEPPLKNDIFKTRVGTPQEFAQLYHELLTIAGLESVIINGYAGVNVPYSRYETPLMKALEGPINRMRGGNYRLQRYVGAWNAVKINDEWKLVDTYWMIKPLDRMVGQGDSEREMISFLNRRMNNLPSASRLSRGKNLDDEYFFAKPRDFVDTHFPFDSKWQLLPVPRTWSSFTD